jgi:hypothetical protein
VLLTYHTSCAVVFGCTGQFLLRREKGFRCYLHADHTSCAIVSVIWFWQEKVFDCTVFKKDSYLVSLRERGSASKCVYFIRSSTLLLWISLCIDLQPYIKILSQKYEELSLQVEISE